MYDLDHIILSYDWTEKRKESVEWLEGKGNSLMFKPNAAMD